MARKDKLTNRERMLARFAHLEEYLTQFLKVYSTPARRWPAISEALEEVGRERMLLQAEMEEGFPRGVRRTKTGG